MFEKGDIIGIIIIAFWIITFSILQKGVLQNAEYYLYVANAKKYNVITADVHKTHAIGYDYIGQPISWKWADITYEYDNQNYDRVIHSYPELTDEENILIAVKEGNPEKVIRCIPYELSRKEKKSIVFSLCLIVGVILYTVIENKVTEKKYRSTYKLQQKKNNDEQESETYQIAKKKLLIMSSVQGCEEVPLDKELVMKLDNPIHEDFIWCLKYLSKTNVADDILLLHMNADGDYEFVAETIRLRQQGLPEQYYVIAIANNNYLCGSADSQRVYCFSQALGVTNTPYATVYDYIMEQIGLR